MAALPDGAQRVRPSAISLLRIARNRDGALEITGRAWREDGKLSARYWSEATCEKRDPSGVFYYHRLERPLDPSAPQLDGTGEIRLESADRASGYWTTRSDGRTKSTRTMGVYLRGGLEDLATLDGEDTKKRVKLLADQLKRWKAIKKG